MRRRESETIENALANNADAVSGAQPEPGTGATTQEVEDPTYADEGEHLDRLAHDADVAWLGIAGGLWSTAGNLKEYQSTTKTKIPLALDGRGSLF